LCSVPRRLSDACSCLLLRRYENARLLAELAINTDVTLGEILSLLYVCDKVRPNEVLVKRRKEVPPSVAFPGSKTKVVLEVLNQIFEEYTAARNSLETSINNVNPLAHPQEFILDAGWVEETEGALSFCMETMTPGVISPKNACNYEQMEIAQKLGVEKVLADDLPKRFYPKVIQETGGIHQAKCYAKVHDAPNGLKYRYLIEDMLYGMVPVVSVGHELGVETLMMDVCIVIGNILAEPDFWKEGG